MPGTTSAINPPDARPLNRKNVPAPHVGPTRLLQFGSGRFLRAFTGWMFDLLNRRGVFHGGITIVLPNSKQIPEAWTTQEGLYHVITNDEPPYLVTAVNEVVSPAEDYGRFLRLGEDPALHFVTSNTTESGITFSDRDKDYRTLPGTFPGKVAALLYHRFVHLKGDPSTGLIFLPCELVPRNGERLQAMVLEYANLWKLPSRFKEWVKASNHFCCTLVDRIVVRCDETVLNGFEDHLAVRAESYSSWVIEADSRARSKLPPMEQHLPVKFVDNLEPYYRRKVRILNGAHTALTPIAHFMGYSTVHHAMTDGFIRNFLVQLTELEIIPTLEMPAVELQQYRDSVLKRFGSPDLHHEIQSIALNATAKIRTRLIPTLLDYVKMKEKSPPMLAFSLATWIRYYKGSWRSAPTPVRDEPAVLALFRELYMGSAHQKEIIDKVLGNNSLWGVNLCTYPDIKERVQAATNWIDNWENNPGLNISEAFLI